MMKKMLLVAIIAALFLTKISFAVQMSSIYQAEIPVATQTLEERNQMLSHALGQVLIKVSGNDQILDNEVISEQLDKATELAQEFSYVNSNRMSGYKPYILKIKFEPNGVNKILRRGSVRVWGSNRPLILAWIEYEAPGQTAEIIDSDSKNAILTLLKKQAYLRGLPLIFPTMDVEDINNVSVNDVVTMNISTLEEAAKRYKSDVILIARVFKLSDDFLAQAKLVQGKNEWDWNISGKTRAEVFEILIDNITEKLTGRYADKSSNKERSNLTMTVAGIMHQEDYASLLNYVQHLVSVVSVRVVKVAGTEVTLNVSLRSTRDSFMQLLSLGNKLTPMPPMAVTGSESNGNLVYQWNHP